MSFDADASLADEVRALVALAAESEACTGPFSVASKLVCEHEKMAVSLTPRMAAALDEAAQHIRNLCEPLRRYMDNGDFETDSAEHQEAEEWLRRYGYRIATSEHGGTDGR